MKILLATDGEAASDGAIRMAASLATTRNATVEVLRVLEPLPLMGEGAAFGAVSLAAEAETSGRGSAALRGLEKAVARIGPPATEWPLKVESGVIPYVIVEGAAERDASLIVLGTGRHGRADRWLGTETALRVMQLAHIPVLAVPPEGGTLPKTVVAAVDFSTFSRDAVSAALRICASDSTVHLVHVIGDPPVLSYVPESNWMGQLREAAQAELDDWFATVPGLSERRVQMHLPSGRVASEVLEIAEREHADLIVAGSHGLGFMGRLLFGSVSKTLLRGAQGSVLIAPPPEPIQVDSKERKRRTG